MTRTSIVDVTEWLQGKHPGFLIKHFIADIEPTGLIRQSGKVGHRGAIKLLSFDELDNHLRIFDSLELNPKEYMRKGYVSAGSLQTDGFQEQVLCFKLEELRSVRYKKVPDDRLPHGITSMVGEVDYWMQEIRNVIQTEEDVAELWPGADPKDIKILALDAGPAYVVGAYAHLPQGPTAEAKDKVVLPDQPSTANTSMKAEADRAIHHSLAVSQKAVFQPVFKFRRWLEGEKSATSDYSRERNRFKRHKFEMKRAKQAEYLKIANRLLGIIGGSIDRHEDNTTPVLIII
ncbi:hypothetical protein BGW38_002624 [Lunasporangiospora selenospora]|uniref:Uncharacterized protein n=1 Tax=Lunasporangiospora selenospora TaxID=979761 RepID=A0A9P6KCS2_9FUNG|nr:hypothetical protein BGW38_002624 [Lunasporangiospora selenospora]